MAEVLHESGEIVPRCGTTLDVYVADVSDVTLSGYQSTQWPEGRLISIHNEAPGVICVRLSLWAGDRLKARRSVDVSMLTTTMLDREWQAALKWRERFLHPERECEIASLDQQTVAYLIADCETMRKFHAAHEAPVVPDAPLVTGEGRTK